jgi:choline-sulfatase
MTRRTFNTALTLGSTALTTDLDLEAATTKPNIVFICSDQHSGKALGANGHPIVKTPNLDRLAAMGVNFRNAYSGNPVCAPGRACMMTGMYASDVGSYCNSTPLGAQPSWGNALKSAGYRCWATGKLDLTIRADYGFEEVKTDHGHSQHPDITSLFRAPVCFRSDERTQIDGRFTDRESGDAEMARRAIEFVRGADAGQPWAVYVGMNMPHPRWVAQKKYEQIYPPEKMPLPEIPSGYLEKRHTMFQVLANFKNINVPIPVERVRRARAAYLGMISEVDEYVGRVLDSLEKAGQLENTLFIYTSDHGEMGGDHGLWLKNVLLENAVRIPLIMAGPGLPKGKVVETAVSHVDMVATILDIAGAPPARKLRGHSLRPLAHGQAGSHPGFAYSESHSEGNCTGSFLIRKGDWKYLYFAGGEPLLFNLKNDPGEFRNLAGKPETAAVEKELHALLVAQVDPEAVSERAFAEQDRRLRARVRAMQPEEFFADLKGRLGATQARVLTNKYYRKTS